MKRPPYNVKYAYAVYAGDAIELTFKNEDEKAAWIKATGAVLFANSPEILNNSYPAYYGLPMNNLIGAYEYYLLQGRIIKPVINEPEAQQLKGTSKLPSGFAK